MPSYENAVNITGCWSNDSFGPVIAHDSCGRDEFDFTLVFEQSVMSIGPSAILLLALPLRWLQLRSQCWKTKKVGIWGWIKLVSLQVLELNGIILSLDVEL